MRGDIEFIGATDEIELVNNKRHGGVALERLRLHLLNMRVGAVAAHPIVAEDADAEREVVDLDRGMHLHANGQPFAGVKDMRWSVVALERDLVNPDASRPPPPLLGHEHIVRLRVVILRLCVARRLRFRFRFRLSFRFGLRDDVGLRCRLDRLDGHHLWRRRHRCLLGLGVLSREQQILGQLHIGQIHLDDPLRVADETFLPGIDPQRFVTEALHHR